MIVRASIVVAALLAGVFFLVKMGPPGWFAVTFALVLVGVSIAFLWPAIVAAAVGYLLLRVALWRARRSGAPRRWGR